MIPILYDQNETQFQSNGIGPLTDTITCVVEEERNGKYELTLTYNADGPMFPELQNWRIILAMVNNKADTKQLQPFRIYYISKPINRIVTVKAEHISYQLSFIPVTPFTENNSILAMSRLRNLTVTTCPFTFWTDMNKSGTVNIEVPTSARSVLGGVKGSILDAYGGEYEWDMWNVRLWASRGHDNGVTLYYGKNITDLQQEEYINSMYTGVMPYWKDESSVVMLPEFVVDAGTASYYPFKKAQIVDFSGDFQTAPTESQLRARTQSYITQNNIGFPKISIKVAFAALWQTEEYKNIAAVESVMLCDTVRVEFEPLGVSVSSKVVKTKFNVMLERYDEITLGDYTRRTDRVWP